MDTLPAHLRSEIACAKSRCLRSSELFDGRKTLTIRHGDEEYRLQITAAGKLILTK